MIISWLVETWGRLIFICAAFHSLLFISVFPFLSWYSINYNNRAKCRFPWPSFGFWPYSYCSEGKNFVMKIMHYFEVWTAAFLRFIRKSNMYLSGTTFFSIYGDCFTLMGQIPVMRLVITINGLKFSGTGSCAKNSCWDIIDWCSCWWCGGNWKCAPIRSWRLSWLTLYLCL